MGLYDRVRIEDGLDVDLPGFDGDPVEADWQTKTFRRSHLDVYKITRHGRLFEEEASHEVVPEEERPKFDDEVGGFETEWHKVHGMLRKVHEGWSDTNYHGTLEFHTRADGEDYAYEAKFTDGTVEAIERVDR